MGYHQALACSLQEFYKRSFGELQALFADSLIWFSLKSPNYFKEMPLLMEKME